VRRRAKYAPGKAATPIAGTSATSGAPVTIETARNAPTPTRIDPAQNCRGVTATPAWFSQSWRLLI
jgi:hypothetical protein